MALASSSAPPGRGARGARGGSRQGAVCGTRGPRLRTPDPRGFRTCAGRRGPHRGVAQGRCGRRFGSPGLGRSRAALRAAGGGPHVPRAGARRPRAGQGAGRPHPPPRGHRGGLGPGKPGVHSPVGVGAHRAPGGGAGGREPAPDSDFVGTLRTRLGPRRRHGLAQVGAGPGDHRPRHRRDAQPPHARAGKPSTRPSRWLSASRTSSQRRPGASSCARCSSTRASGRWTRTR